MKKALAELIGTFVLVFFGCGSAVFAGDQAGMLPLGIAFAFGLAIVAMAYGIGPVSGCHVNPAVSLGAYIAGRMNAKDLLIYIVSQCIGAILGAAVLYVILSGRVGGYDVATSGLGQNGWGAGYQGGYGVAAAFTFEVVATFIFLVVILGSTHKLAPIGFAGLAIGLTLTVIHIVGIRITGVSVNPARSLGRRFLSAGRRYRNCGCLSWRHSSVRPRRVFCSASVFSKARLELKLPSRLCLLREFAFSPKKASRTLANRERLGYTPALFGEDGRLAQRESTSLTSKGSLVQSQ